MMTGMFSRAHASQTGFSVDLQARSVGLRAAEAQALRDLQADRAVRHRLLEIRDRLLRPAGSAGAVPLHVREDPEAIRILAVPDEVDLLLDLIGIRPAAQVHQDAQIECVHVLDHLPDIVRGDRRVVVAVDDRVLRLRDQVLLGHQRRSRPIVDDARNGKLRRRAALRPRFGGSRRALLARLDLHAATASTAAPAASPLASPPLRRGVLRDQRADQHA
jgi:hypothetical protein